MSLLRRAAKYIIAYTLFLTGALAWARRRAMRHGIAVLTLHRVLPDSEFSRTSSLPGIVVRERTFEHLAAYVRRRCTAVDLGSRPDPGQRASSPRVALTFDDGWSDNGAVAAATLGRHGIPAVIFVCPGLIGRPFPFWPERAAAALRISTKVSTREVESFIERLKLKAPSERAAAIDTLEGKDLSIVAAGEPLNATLSWEEIRALAGPLLRFGSHTYSHQILTQIPENDIRAELLDSRLALEERLGVPCRTFAYPNGNWSAAILEQVRTAGYQLAFTTSPGLWTKECEALAIPRFNISEGHLIGPTGRFSRVMFEYTVFWRAAVTSIRAAGSR